MRSGSGFLSSAILAVSGRESNRRLGRGVASSCRWTIEMHGLSSGDFRAALEACSWARATGCRQSRLTADGHMVRDEAQVI